MRPQYLAGSVIPHFRMLKNDHQVALACPHRLVEHSRAEHIALRLMVQTAPLSNYLMGHCSHPSSSNQVDLAETIFVIFQPYRLLGPRPPPTSSSSTSRKGAHCELFLLDALRHLSLVLSSEMRRRRILLRLDACSRSSRLTPAREPDLWDA